MTEKHSNNSANMHYNTIQKDVVSKAALIIYLNSKQGWIKFIKSDSKDI